MTPEEDTAADHDEEVGIHTEEVDSMDDSMEEGRVELLDFPDLVELEDNIGEVVAHTHITFLHEKEEAEEDNDWLESYHLYDQPPMLMSLELEELMLQLLLVPILEE